MAAYRRRSAGAVAVMLNQAAKAKGGSNEGSTMPAPSTLMTRAERDDLRRALVTFGIGARLHSDDVRRLLSPLGLSNNRLRCLGTDSYRGDPIRPAEFRFLMEAWMREQRHD
jgi:hypothetical protein